MSYSRLINLVKGSPHVQDVLLYEGWLVAGT